MIGEDRMLRYEYVTVEWRIGEAARDIGDLLESMGPAWRLAFVLEEERVLILERAR